MSCGHLHRRRRTTRIGGSVRAADVDRRAGAGGCCSADRLDVTTPWNRDEHGALAGVKSISYAENVRALRYAAERQATEAIFLNATAGHVCEGTGSNIFLVFGDTIITPPLSSGPLAGITRELIMEWSSVQERDLTLDEAKRADEVFITSSNAQRPGSSPAVGCLVFRPRRPVTQALAINFADRSGADLDP